MPAMFKLVKGYTEDPVIAASPENPKGESQLGYIRSWSRTNSVGWPIGWPVSMMIDILNYATHLSRSGKYDKTVRISGQVQLIFMTIPVCLTTNDKTITISLLV